MYLIQQRCREPWTLLALYVTDSGAYSLFSLLSVYVVRSGWRQDWRSRVPLRLTLRLNLAHQHDRSPCADGDASRLRAAHPIEDLLLVVGRQNAVQRRLRCPDDAHPANQFVGPSVHVHAIDHQRNHLERLWRTPRRHSEARRDVLE